MLNLSSRLRPYEAGLAAKVVDGEAIIINLSNGMYYSMDQVGALIWTMVVDGATLEEIVSATVRSYDVSPAQAQADVERVAAELLEEELVTAADRHAPARIAPDSAPRQRLPYESPQLIKYRDMADLLALDPPMPGLNDIPRRELSGESSPGTRGAKMPDL